MNHPGKYLIGLCIITSIIINTAHGMTKSRRQNNIGVIVVDIQADFVNLPVIDPRTLQKTPSTLAVNTLTYGDTDQNYIRAAEKFTQDMRAYNMPIFFTQDWHPKSPIPHVSFASTWTDKGYKDIKLFEPFPDADLPLKPEDKEYKVEGQVMWPDHCIQGSPGARILLKAQPQDTVIQKGANPYVESYSGFEDKDGTKTPLTSELHKRGVTDVIVFGIATDFCVNFTALDALKDGFGVHLVINLSRSVDANLIDQRIEDLITFGANVYYISGLNDGWTPSAAIKAKLKTFGVIECTNVADFLNKVHMHMRKGKAVSKIPSIEKESLLEKELARSFAGKLPTGEELQSGITTVGKSSQPGGEETPGNLAENAALQARDTLRLESEKLRSLLKKISSKSQRDKAKKEIEAFILSTSSEIKPGEITTQDEIMRLISTFEAYRKQLLATYNIPSIFDDSEEETKTETSKKEVEIKSRVSSQGTIIQEVKKTLDEESRKLRGLLARVDPSATTNASQDIEAFIHQITEDINQKITNKQLKSTENEIIRVKFKNKLSELERSYFGGIEITGEATF